MIDANPRGELAQRILQFMVDSDSPADGSVKQRVWNMLAERYAADERIGNFVGTAIHFSRGGAKLLERVAAVNPDRALQAQAILGLGQRP